MNCRRIMRLLTHNTGKKPGRQRAIDVIVFVALLFVPLLSGGCEPGSKKESPVPGNYVKRVKTFRIEKDRFFKNSEQSPLPEELRRSFQGLTYYSPDPAFRIKGTYHPYKEPVKRGGWMLAVGRFSFSLAERELDLEVWSSGSSEELSIMFTDPTNKDETYKAGRYVELKGQVDGSFIIDFNYAYNPYCHYNPVYVCPLPPPENHIPIPVQAGEKRLDLADSEP